MSKEKVVLIWGADSSAIRKPLGQLVDQKPSWKSQLVTTESSLFWWLGQAKMGSRQVDAVVICVSASGEKQRKDMLTGKPLSSPIWPETALAAMRWMWSRKNQQPVLLVTQEMTLLTNMYATSTFRQVKADPADLMPVVQALEKLVEGI